MYYKRSARCISKWELSEDENRDVLLLARNRAIGSYVTRIDYCGLSDAERGFLGDLMKNHPEIRSWWKNNGIIYIVEEGNEEKADCRAVGKGNS